MLLQINTKEGALDLPEGADKDFYVTKQLRDVHDMDTREGDFTKTLQLPYTPNNLRLIGAQTPLLTRHKNVGTQFISVQVLMSGFPVLDSPIMRIESGDSKHFTATLFGGVVGFFVQLSDAPIGNLDWSGANYNFEWTAAELVARKNVTIADDNVVFPNCNWYTNDSIELARSKGGADASTNANNIQLPLSGFFMYVDTVMRKITGELQGLIVDYGDLEKEDRYNRLAFANKMPLLRDEYSLPSGGTFIGRASKTETSINGQLDYKAPLIASFESGISMVNFEWVIPTRGSVEISQFLIRGTMGAPPDATISIMKNDELVRSYLYNIAGTNVRIDDAFTFQAEANDRIWLRVQTRGTAGVAMISNFGLILSLQRRSVNEGIQIGNLLPAVSQREFVRSVFNMFNIIVVQTQGQVTFKLWDKIPQAEPLDFDVDMETPPIESGLWAGYSTRNNVTYTPNPLVARQDENAFFDIKVANTETARTKIELPFTTLDDSIADAANGQTRRSGVPSLVLDFEQYENAISWDVLNDFTTIENHNLQIGDIIIGGAGGAMARVLTIKNSKEGRSQQRPPNAASYSRTRVTEAESSPLHLALMNTVNGTFRILDGGLINDSQGDFKNAVFDSSLTWSTLLNDYFKNLVNAVSNPFRLLAWFDISILTYISIDQTRPVYLKSYGALFYINRIEQFKSFGKVRMELLQVGASVNLVADPQGLQVGAFDNSFSNDFDNYDQNEI